MGGVTPPTPRWSAQGIRVGEVADGKAELIAIELRGKRSPHVTLVVQHSRNNDLEI